MSQELPTEPLITKTTLTAAGTALLAAVVILAFMGRIWWCKEGDLSPWSWDIWSTHNSQHFIDPYSITHLLHGVAEFWLIGLIFYKVPLAWRFVMAICLESTWEVVENTNMIIERYREATMSLDYFGDSILNSVADILCCGLGFWIAYKLRFWKSMTLFIVTEIILALTIRDSLILNVIMLLCPVEAIKQWQMGG
ncbi:MAG: DUF2585 family protein [Acidobacteria bacterium]|nr:DUF2585 family protein [Acidobacteriota bacterium]